MLTAELSVADARKLRLHGAVAFVELGQPLSTPQPRRGDEHAAPSDAPARRSATGASITFGPRRADRADRRAGLRLRTRGLPRRARANAVREHLGPGRRDARAAQGFHLRRGAAPRRTSIGRSSAGRGLPPDGVSRRSRRWSRGSHGHARGQHRGRQARRVPSRRHRPPCWSRCRRATRSGGARSMTRRGWRTPSTICWRSARTSGGRSRSTSASARTATRTTTRRRSTAGSTWALTQPGPQRVRGGRQRRAGARRERGRPRLAARARAHERPRAPRAT